MLGGIKDGVATVRVALLLLLLAGSGFALVGCGGGGGGGGGGEETTVERTSGGETTAERTSGGETTSARTAGGETTAARGGEVTTAQFASANLTLTPSGDSGVSGNANITDTPGGVEVALDVQGLLTQPGTEHVAHIHEGGTCADERAGNGAPVLYPLDPLVAKEDGTASSATSLDGVAIRQLTSGAPKYVNVHAEPTGEAGVVPPGIACADIPMGG
jgi:hypothetical protein